jgi:hypothetical protein
MRYKMLHSIKKSSNFMLTTLTVIITVNLSNVLRESTWKKT